MSSTALQKVGKKTIATRSRTAERRDKRWLRDKGRDSLLDERQVAQFGRMLYTECKDGKALTRKQVAKIVHHVNGGKEVTEQMASAWISRVRDFIIREYNETFIYIRINGESHYKLAQGYEKPMHVAKVGHMALKWKYRFLLSSSILNPDDMKAAGASLILKLKKDLGHDNNGQLMIASVKDDMKLLKSQAI